MGDPSPRLRLVTFQAAFGDCLMVEARADGWTRRVLIDGGPAGTYQAVLRPSLEAIARTGGRIDAAVVSHIDNDHIAGMLDLFDELRARRADAGEPALPPIDRLWHNSFDTAVGDAGLEPAVRSVLRDATGLAAAMPALGMVLRGVGEGDALRADAFALGIGAQPFADGRVLADGGRGTMFDGLAVTVVGPSAAILDRLRKEWLAWLAAHREREAPDDPATAAAAAAARAAAVAADGSVPNLSSIALLVELGGRSILLTGDARADQVLEGMGEAGVLDAAGRRHVSILKMPHHGSIRNVSPAFLAAVTADTYVISADGRYGNPDYEALVLIVESARPAARTIELAMTNVTPSSERLLASHPPERNGYQLRILPTGRAALLLDARPVAGAKAKAWPT
jgi:beta-lactamase superfamily II metal-dependent hydrolase